MSESMTDLLSNLPVELFRQIISLADDDTLTNLARTSKQFRQVADECLYKNLESPWPLIQLVLEPVKRMATPAERYKSPNPSGGFVCASFA
jgi:F-box-like